MEVKGQRRIKTYAIRWLIDKYDTRQCERRLEVNDSWLSYILHTKGREKNTRLLIKQFMKLVYSYLININMDLHVKAFILTAAIRHAPV